MKRIFSLSIIITIFVSLFNLTGNLQNYTYANSVHESVYSNNPTEQSSIGILSTSVYPDNAVVKYGEKIYINYSFNAEAHPVLINIYKDGVLQADYYYKPSSWGDHFSYEPKDEGSYRFVVKPTDQPYYTNECTVTVYKDRIIFLPGIMGSELFLGDEQVWEPEDSKNVPRIREQINSLQMSALGESKNSISVRNSISDYDGILAFFKNEGYHVVDFPYDWRLGSSINAQKLKERINIERAASPYSNYYIVAHSMGGLVATEFIRQGNSNLIKKLITIGTPFLGAPQAFNMLETGNLTNEYLAYLTVGSAVRNLEKNTPSIYELLPNKSYFSYQTNGYIETKSYPKPDGPKVKVTKYNTFSETENFIKDTNDWSNDVLLENAKNFHSSLDVLNTLKKVDSYFIVGDQRETPGKLVYYVPSLNDKYLSDVKVIQGDGVVPTSSATVGFKLDETRTFYIGRSHVGLVKSPEVQQKILKILKDKPNEFVSDKIRDETKEIKTLKFKAECPVELHIYDSSGNHTGPTGAETFESKIPDINYFTDGETKIALVNDTEDYKVRIIGTGYGELTFSIVWANEKDIEDRTLRFDNVAVTPTSVFIADVNQNGQVVLQIDQNGDDNFEGSISPTVDLDLGGTQDETIPTLSSHIDGVKGVNEWYGKNVYYNLSGEDNASGVYKYFYDLNDSEYKEYTEPLALPNTGIYNFKSYVRDKNRNDSEVLTETVKVDTTNPTVPVMTIDPTAWTNKYVTITLGGGTDADSGFQKYQYIINQDGEWKDYTVPFVIDSEGLYNVYARSVDNVFNLSAEVTGVAKVDKTNPPKPIMTIEPSKWTNQSVSITLSGGTDTDKGFPNSGFQKYQYKIDGGEWKDYTTPIIIDTEGLFKVIGRSVDTATNLSEEVSGEAKIDRTKPMVPVMTIEPLKWTNQFVTVTLSGGFDTDKGFPNSGFQKYHYKIDRGEWKDYTTPIIIDTEGLYTIYARAADIATNLSEEVTGEAKVDRINPSSPRNFITKLLRGNKVTLSWSPSTDNVAVTSYDLYQDSKLVGNVVNPEFTFENLVANRDYIFKAVARDEAGNSSIAASFTVRTPVNLAVGSDHTLQIKEDGTVRGWGMNSSGELGDGTYSTKTTAVPVLGLTSVKSVAVGKQHSIALKEDGTVWTWGGNAYGQLGNGPGNSSNKPNQVRGLEGIVAVAASQYSSYALKNDGTVWSWGENYNGQLGNNTTTDQSTPVQVSGISGISQITAGKGYAYAMTSAGTAWGWGDGRSYQIPGSSGSNTLIAVPMTGLEDLASIVAGEIGNRGLALKKDGSVVLWGGNYQRVFTLNPLSGIQTIVGGGGNFAIREDGSLWRWDGYTPVKVEGISEVSAVGVAYNDDQRKIYTAAVKTDGSVWAWGDVNQQGQLGDGTTDVHTTPALVKENTAPEAVLTYPLGSQGAPEKSNVNQPTIRWIQKDAALTSFTAYQVQVLDENGAVVVDSGEVKQAANANNSEWIVSQTLPSSQLLQVRVKVFDDQLWSEWSSVGWLKVVGNNTLQPTRVAVSGNFVLQIKEDGTVRGWGMNSSGELGDGTNSTKTTAVSVQGLTSVKSVAVGKQHSIALKEDGTVWTWGGNAYGQLGNGPGNNSNTPTQVRGLEGIVAVAASQYSSYALKNDGTVWSWGENYNGQLGNNSTIDQSTPVRVLGISGISQITAGKGYAYAMTSAGTAWGWGDGRSYQIPGSLGSNMLMAVPMTGLEDLASIVAGEIGNRGLALKKDGSVVLWGGNYQRVFTLNPLSGIQTIVGGGGNFAIREDGSLWRWDGYTPVKVEGISEVSAVGVAYNDDQRKIYTAAVKTDGSAWAWGDVNQHGQLGDGTTDVHTTPALVKENTAPEAVLTYPLGSKEAPEKSNVNQPTIRWIQKDAALTRFAAYQVQILDASGNEIVDSGIVSQPMTATENTWMVSEALPSGQAFQVKVKVFDEHLWSEWSELGWIEINNMILKTKKQLDSSVEMAQSTIYVGEPTIVKLSVVDSVYSDDGINTGILNGIAKVKVSGYTISNTEFFGKFGDVELSATGTTTIDVQFHDGIAEIPLILTMSGKQSIAFEIVDLENSLRLVEIEVLPNDLSNVLLFPSPTFNEAPIKDIAYSHKSLLRRLI